MLLLLRDVQPGQSAEGAVRDGQEQPQEADSLAFRSVAVQVSVLLRLSLGNKVLTRCLNILPHTEHCSPIIV